MPRAAELLRDDRVRCRLRVVSPWYTEALPGFRPSLLDWIAQTTQAVDGKVVFHADGTDGGRQFGDIGQWRASSLGAASAVLSHLDPRASASVVLATDTPYAGVGEHLARQLRHTDVPLATLWTPHSTGRNHGLPDDGSRYEWERAAAAATGPRCFVGAINSFMHDHLVKEYGADPGRIVAFTNGLPLHLDVGPVAPAAEVTEELGIEAGRRYVVACGRAERYKGFLELIQAFHATQHRHGLDLLLVLSELTRQDPVLMECRRLISDLGVRASIVGTFLSQDKLRALIRLENTAVFAVPSLAEPFGILPLEVRWWCMDDGPVIVVSDRDGLRDLVRDGLDGYRAEVTSEAFGEALARAANAGAAQRREMLAAGRQDLFARYDYSVNIARCLSELCRRIGAWRAPC